MQNFSYGLELELSDVDRSVSIPIELGSWEGDLMENGYYGGAEIDIVNTLPPFRGICTDPLAETCTVGGEINVQPTTNIAGQFTKVNQIYNLFKRVTTNQIAHYHIHVYIPQLHTDVDSLKNFIKYSIRNQKDLIDIVYHQNLNVLPFFIDKDFYINDGGRYLNEAILEKIENTNKIEEIKDILFTETIKHNGEISTSKRAGINLSNLKNNKTVEFRCFRGTINNYELCSQLIFVQKFCEEALKNSNKSVIDINSKGNYSFAKIPYEHDLHIGSIKTRHSKERGNKYKYSKPQFIKPMYETPLSEWFKHTSKILPYKRFTSTGTHSTGKTTVIDSLKEKLSSYVFYSSVTRRLAKESNIKLNTECNDKSQFKIITEIIKHYEKQALEENNTIEDRSFIDTVAYTKYFYEKGIVSKKVYDYCIENFEKIYPMYEHVFYFKTEFEMEEDGVRVKDEEYRQEVEQNIEWVLKKYNIPFTTISGTVKERVQQILGVIEENNAN